MKYYKEILVLEAILFLLIWLSNEYLAVLLTFIAVPIFAAILVISWIAEKIEESKISNDYFKLIAGLALMPVLLFLFFQVIGGAQYLWLKEN